MKLDVLQAGIRDFAGFLSTKEADLHFYKYAMFSRFHETWVFNTEDFPAVYDHAIQSNVTRRWWKRPNYRPKEVMQLLIRTDPDYAIHMFKDLYDESKDISGRIDRFIFYSDELLRMYRAANRIEIVNNHYQDMSIISFYLSGKYPEKYTLYPGREIFNALLIKLHARKTGERDDLPRFFKIMRLILQFVFKEPAMDNHLKTTPRNKGNLLLSHEFMYYLIGKWNEPTP
jgi:hypothetical protein